MLASKGADAVPLPYLLGSCGFCCGRVSAEEIEPAAPKNGSPIEDNGSNNRTCEFRRRGRSTSMDSSVFADSLPLGELAHSPLVITESLQVLQARLEAAGIDVKAFGQGTSKSLESLHWELHELRSCVLRTQESGRLFRVLAPQVEVELVAQDINGSWRHLVSTEQLLYDGRTRQRKDPVRKTFMESMSWDSAMRDALTVQVALSAEFQDRHLVVDTGSYSVMEELKASNGYPGLSTLYRVHKVLVRVNSVDYTELGRIGLPEGRDFAVMEGKVGEQDFAARLRLWAWEPWHGPGAAAPREAGGDPGRVPLFPRLRRSLQLSNVTPSTPPPTCPNAVLRERMTNAQTDWSRATCAAQCIRDPTYSLRMFFDDCVAAFPELGLYHDEDKRTATTSGRTGEDEYQRTIGALFAFYWVMRLDIDGKEGFAFGVDSSWNVKRLPEFDTLPEFQQRFQFYETTDWEALQKLLVDAGLLREDHFRYSVCSERCLAMLVLTAIHDIMKAETLLPEVHKCHAPYKGFDHGCRINDHDIALAYVLQKYPGILPSYAGLDDEKRKPVEFTQSKLDYNQGWLVQGEAPPGALFHTFKELLQHGKVPAADVSFYFVHWLTDLAGAEPCPLRGAEKFVLKFPHVVLQAFVRSFPLVQQLAHASETEVYEQYLVSRWTTYEPALGPLPVGEEGIAVMRLACQAQQHAVAVVEAFWRMDAKDRRSLSREMSRTGCPGQHYAHVGEANAEEERSPAILVYYAPALLQRFGATESSKALERLHKVYTQARALFPAGKPGCVTVRIDTIKDLSAEDIAAVHAQGEVFVLVKHNSQEAFVERHATATTKTWDVNRMNACRLLQFSCDLRVSFRPPPPPCGK